METNETAMVGVGQNTADITECKMSKTNLKKRHFCVTSLLKERDTESLRVRVGERKRGRGRREGQEDREIQTSCPVWQDLKELRNRKSIIAATQAAKNEGFSVAHNKR